MHISDRRILIIAVLLFAITVFPRVSLGDINKNAGTRAMSFLKIGVGAEAIGMGESHVAAANDLYSSYWNPAGLSHIQRSQFGFMHNQWFEDIKHEYIGYVQPLGGLGVIGTSILYLSYGEIQGRDENGQETNKFRPYDLALVFSYGRGLVGDSTVGFNAKWIREQIDKENAQVYAFDIGVLYPVGKSGLIFGLNLQNFGTKAKFVKESFELPTNLKLGLSYKLREPFMITADLNRPADDDINIGIGAELKIANLLRLRGGYKYSLGGNDLGVVSGLTTGLGVTVEGFQIDYAFANYGKLGSVHRVSLIANL